MFVLVFFEIKLRILRPVRKLDSSKYDLNFRLDLLNSEKEAGFFL